MLPWGADASCVLGGRPQDAWPAGHLACRAAASSAHCLGPWRNALSTSGQVEPTQHFSGLFLLILPDTASAASRQAGRQGRRRDLRRETSGGQRGGHSVQTSAGTDRVQTREPKEGRMGTELFPPTGHPGSALSSSSAMSAM